MPRLPPPLKFQTIVADPPWPYDTSVSGAWAIPKSEGQFHQKRVDQMGYEVMSIDDICNLAVKSFGAKNSHLYLWTTNAFLVEAHTVAEAWGFKPKTMLTWGKFKEDHTPSLGTGYYFRGTTEHCLFCTRGSLRITPKSVKGTLYLSSREPHSKKPTWFYELVEECSPLPALELFARRKRYGWYAWGNEIESDIVLGAIN